MFKLPKFGNKRSKALQTPEESEIDKIFDFLFSQINRQDLISGLKNSYTNSRTLHAEEKLKAQIVVLRELVDFILNNHPLVVKRDCTVDELNLLVQKKINPEAVPKAIKLMFFSEPIQDIYLFELTLTPLLIFIQKNIPLPNLIKLIKENIRSVIFQNMTISENNFGLNLPEHYILESHKTGLDFAKEFKPVYAFLHKTVAENFGQKTADSIITKSFEELKTTYGVVLATKILDILPSGVLEEEKETLLSREKLITLVQTATASEVEKRTNAETSAKDISQKIKIIEKQNVELSESKTAILNILQDEEALEKKLSQEKDQLNAILSSMGESLLTVDVDLKITIINPAAQKLLGISENDAMGRVWAEVVSIYEKDKKINVQERTFAKVIKTGKAIITTSDQKHYYYTKGGRKFIVSSVTSPIFSNKQVIGAVKVFRDSTSEQEEKDYIEKQVVERTQELKVEQKQLKESEQRLFKFLDFMPLGIFVLDKVGKPFYANKETLRILGEGVDRNIKLEEITSHYKAYKAGTNELYPIDTLPSTKIIKGELNTDQITIIKDMEIRKKSLTIPVEIIVKPIRNSEGQLEFVLSVITDVTEQRIIERSKDEFFSIASHELRTPLSAIRGNTALILDYFAKDIKDEEFKNMIIDIHESAIRLIGIVNDFLDTSRLEQGRLQFQMERFIPNDTIEEAIEEIKNLAVEKGLDVKFINNKNIEVLADKNRVKQIIANLVGNAIKFTEKGTITISTSIVKDFLEIEVVDSGRGIPIQNQTLLFRKFQQANTTLFTRDTTKGTGLGLFISKMLISGMGGHIYLKNSQENKGSTFAFTLQLAQKSLSLKKQL